MAQDTTPAERPETASEGEPGSPGFHYYSGGEVKELSNTSVSPILWAFWSVVIVGAVAYLLLGGALGPNSPLGKGYQAPEGKTVALNAVQKDLNFAAYNGGENAQEADMVRLLPEIHQYAPGESLTTAVSNGSNLYQTYCIGCHGPNQDGNGVNASSLNPKPRNLHDAPFMRETLTPQRINYSLHYGVHGTAMPRWENTLSEKEIQEVKAYVLSLTWDMPPASMDTTTDQLATPVDTQSTPSTVKPTSSSTTVPKPANSSVSKPVKSPVKPTVKSPIKSTVKSPAKPLVKSPSGSVTGGAGGSFVRGNNVMVSPAPATAPIDGNPAAATSSGPPSSSGAPAGVKPTSGM